MESSLMRGNLSLPCPNHSTIFVSQTSCCSLSQTVCRGLSNGLDSRRCMIFMTITGTKRTSGKQDMEKMHKGGKEAYTNGYRIIREKTRTGKRDKFQKVRTEGQDNVPLFIILPFGKSLENLYFPDIMK